MFESLTTTTSIIAAILGFGFIIFVHELGHFVAAKLFKVHVKAFSLGFPPNILHKQVGETDYRLGLIPMGGYVSMVGDDPTEASPDPRALSNQKPWKRAVVFLAGVGMNVISAMLIYMIASFIGIQAVPAVVGAAQSGSPAQTAGLQPEDRIVAIDDSPVEEFSDIHFLVLTKGLDSPKHIFTVDILRDGQPMQFKLPSRAGDLAGTTMQVPQFGVQPPVLPVVSEIAPDSPAAMAGLKLNDQILQVNSTRTPFLMQAQDALAFPGNDPVTIVVSRREDDGTPREVTLTVDPSTITTPWYGLIPPPYVDRVVAGSPAEAAGIMAGDHVIAVEGLQRPLTVTSMINFVTLTGQQPINLTLLRGSDRVNVTVTPRLNLEEGRPMIGVGFGDVPKNVDQPRVFHAAPESPLALAGVPDGARILSIGDRSTGSWRRYFEAIQALDGKPVTITYSMPGTEGTKQAQVTPLRVPPESLLSGITSSEGLRERLDPVLNPITALGKGLRKMHRLAMLQYVTIKGLFTGQVPTRELGGPIRIGTGFYQAARAGSIAEFMMFLALVSVAIAMLNIMPIPPLDGGHIMFLAIEKVSGRPVPDRLRSAVTMVGTVLLLSLVVFVFYNDIRYILTRYII